MDKNKVTPESVNKAMAQAKVQKTVEAMSVEELKALCYDQIVLLQQAQNNVNILQAEINKREKESKNGQGG